MSGSFQDSEQSEFIQAFVDEGREMLENVEPLLIELESRSDISSVVDSEVLNTIFRLFHSLKGAAGFLHLNTVAKVTHEAETLLDLFRKGHATLTSQHIDLLNRTTDFLGQLINNIETQMDDSGFEAPADDIVKDLKLTINSLSNSDGQNPGAPEPSKETKLTATPSVASTEIGLSAENLENPQADGAEDGDNLQLDFTPEMVKQFISESEELLEKAESALISMEKEPGNKEFISEAFRALHSFKGNCGFFGYADLEKISHRAESVLDILRGEHDSSPEEALTLILEIIDFLRSGISSLVSGKEPTIPGVQGLIALLESAAAKLNPSAAAEKSSASQNCNEANKPELAETEIPPPSAARKNPDPQPHINSNKQPGNSVSSTPKGKQDNTQSLAAPDDDRQTADRKLPEVKNSQRQSIRVDIEKLDVLMDLVGELVIAEAMVAQNPDLKSLNTSLDRFEKSIMQLDKITRELQSISTSIRMIPLSGTFRKMIRLVRDLAQKSGKKVALDIVGEETEVDKTVIEQINDPLVHIIRNSIDHGLETPDARQANGKPPTGNVVLEAKYVGGEVWIIIRDDGNGLNRERILAKALERGLIEDDGSEMRDEDVWQLIFQPGFSTADKITDVSGRGVGMDVVRRNIEGIHGKVEVRSEKGRGTMIILKIPLTLAIIDGMIVQVGNNLYTIPVMSIKESFRIKMSSVTKTMDGQEIVNIRGQLLPIVRVHELFGIPSNCLNLDEGTIIVVENEHKSICLFVDEVVRQQQVVIKGLTGFVGNLDCIAGCTILGDGDISLIMDIVGVMNSVENGRLINPTDGYHTISSGKKVGAELPVATTGV